MEHGNRPRVGAIRRYDSTPRAANRGRHHRGRGMGRGSGFHRPPGPGGHDSISQQQGCQTPPVLDCHPGSAPICSRYQTRSGCLGHNCSQLHICRNFLAGSCMFGDRCSELHRLAGSHNQAVCDQYWPDLDMNADQDLLLWRLRRAVLATLTERDVCRSLQLCLQFSSAQGCSKTDCNRLHVCRRLVEGGCSYGGRCFYTHTLLLPEYRMCSLEVNPYSLSSEFVSGRGRLDTSAADHNTTIITNLGLQDLPQDRILSVLIEKVQNRALEVRLNRELVPIDCGFSRSRPPNSSRAHGENVPGLPATELCQGRRTVKLKYPCNMRLKESSFAAAAASGSVQKPAGPQHEEQAAEPPDVAADALKALVEAKSGEMEAKLMEVAEQIQARSLAAMAKAESNMAASAAALAAQSAALETKSTAISYELKCPICLEYLREAINTGCGHSFCKACLEQLKRHSAGLYRAKCPQCRKDITSETRSFALDSVIRQMKQ